MPPVKLFSASLSAGLFRWIHASPGAGLWPAGLPPAACCCQSRVRGDTVVRGGEELRDCASELLSPSSAVQVILSSHRRRNWPPFLGHEEGGICRTTCWEMQEGCVKNHSSPTGRSQKGRLVVIVPSDHSHDKSPASCPKTLAWAHASHPSAPLA